MERRDDLVEQCLEVVFVGGSGHVNTEVMRAAPGVLAKGGAEGVIGMTTADGRAVAVPGLGVCLPERLSGGWLVRATGADGVSAVQRLAVQ